MSKSLHDLLFYVKLDFINCSRFPWTKKWVYNDKVQMTAENTIFVKFKFEKKSVGTVGIFK